MKTILKYEIYQKFLVNTKTPHTIRACSSSTTIHVENRSYFFPNGEKIESKYLKFIGDTKQEVIQNSERLNLPQSKPKYFGFTKIYGESKVYDVLEVDIKGAYWKTAHSEGLITTATFEKGLAVPKHIRLMAFGASATLKDVQYFNGYDYELKEPEFSEYGRRAFFHVANLVGNLMHKICQNIPDKFILYWVDAIFVHSLWSPYVFDVLQKNGYGWTVKSMPVLILRGGNGTAPDTVTCIERTSETADLCTWERKTFKNQKRKTKKIISKN